MDQPPDTLDFGRRILGGGKSLWQRYARYVVPASGPCLPRTLDEPARKRWARHGSTRRIWEAQSVLAAILYVVDEQGEAMEVFQDSAPSLARAARTVAAQPLPVLLFRF